MLTLDPILLNERTLKDEPNETKSSTDIPLPNFIAPRMLNPLPIRTPARIDMLLPKFTPSRILAMLPN
jgi:hypothetical protein